MPSGQEMLAKLADRQDLEVYQKTHWSGTFAEYLEVVRANPTVSRTAYQRLYDMILGFGTDEVIIYKEKLTRYKFFDDPMEGGKDAVFGLERTLMNLVNVLKSAAHRYGTERRVLLLHGPVGSSKSTIVRLLKKGLEHYSQTDPGALYTYGWREEPLDGEPTWVDCPMHEEPLRLVPLAQRKVLIGELLAEHPDYEYGIVAEGDLCPFCRHTFNMRMEQYGGDWMRVLGDVRVRRLILSEQDRVGIGTFQPKDEKNQDATELTGDINYRKIAEYGSDSDPRAFNFDGEFNVANRGIIEFIEVLKLDVAFLYDLLGASQEHKIKPKKFAQTDIDEVIIGHSVAGSTPILYRHDGRPRWSTIGEMFERYEGLEDETPGRVEVLALDFEGGRTTWTPVRRLLRHRFEGRMIATSQKWGAVETTPNHSIYGRDGRTFFPDEPAELMAVRTLDAPMTETAAEALEVIDVVAGVEGFARSAARVTAGGGPMTRPCPEGWARIDLPRHATAIRAEYDPIADADALRDLITVLVWYATEGHLNGNSGLVISQADRAELERVQAAYSRISTGRGSINSGAKIDSAWRLTLGSTAIARLAEHHCGRRSPQKRLPDFLFGLPEPFLQHAFDELMRTDGTRKTHDALTAVASETYRNRFFEYKTISPVLASQVGTLATLLGHDYAVYRHERPGRDPAYRIRFVSGVGKRGGRQDRCDLRRHDRPALDEWVYDIECVGLHNFVCGVGNVVCHNTNEPEYKKLQSNEFMEALRDRTVKIDVPYVTRLADEVQIYEKDYNARKVKGKHIAPHTLEVAAMWAVLTRLEEPKNAGLTLLQKLRLYNGKTLPGFTEDNIKELREEAEREGMLGISPRYVQDKISNALVGYSEARSINPFMVLNELEGGLKHHSLINHEDTRKHYKHLLSVVKEEYDDLVKNEVQRAIAADEDALTRLCGNYIDNVKAYTQHEKVKNKYTGQTEEPDERLMRSIEDKIDIPESRKDDFRREIMNYIGALAIDGLKFDYKTNERLQKALELKLFQDQKDTIKLTSLVSSVVDADTQEKIDIVKQRLIRNYGYDEDSANDVLNYVASIFARGDVKGGR